MKVLYEDNHLIAVFKPAGLLTQGDKTQDISLMDLVKEYLKKKYKKQGNVFLGLIHRLDRPASGIVLFAKTSKGASRISEQFRNHTVEKIYHVIVEGKPEQNRGVLENILKKNNVSKKAELYYEVLKTNDKISLLKITLKTGRYHQIREQLSLIGCPVLGDKRYGSSIARKDILLTATSLSFYLPTKQERKTIQIPLPENMVALF